jgi:hypothetical protein
MVNIKHLLIALTITLIFCAPMLAKEFYQFPQVTDSQLRDLFLVRRPAAAGYNNNTGTRNISASTLFGQFNNFTGSARRELRQKLGADKFSQFSSWAASELAKKHTISAHQAYSTAVALQLAAKVSTNDPRLSDARTPLAHSQSASTITGLATVATTGSYPDLSNKPTIPVACGSDPATAIFDGVPGTPGAPGAPGATGERGHAGISIFCNISGPVRAFSYDTGGLNPFPPLQAFGAQLWEGATRLVIQAYEWWTGGPGNTVSGSGTAATFTPSVKSVFKNRSTNNYVAVQVRYSTALGGGRYCRTGIPISVTQPGAKGEKGDSGVAVVTKSSVTDQFTALTAGGSPMYFFPGDGQTDATLQIGVGDLLKNLRLKILPSGMILIIRPDGKYDFMYDTTSRKLRLGNYSTASSRSNVVIDNTGMITGYKRNGTVVAYTLHSSLVIR